MEGKSSKTIKSFQDLRVYQGLYDSMRVVHKGVIPSLPPEEKYGLADQLRRSSKAGPALLAEGFAKRYQLRQWRKYLNDALGECNETIHHLSVCRDVYPGFIDGKLCRDLIDRYDKCCRQLTRLEKVWQDYHAQGK